VVDVKKKKKKKVSCSATWASLRRVSTLGCGGCEEEEKEES